MLQTTLYKWTNNAAAGTNYQRIPKRTAADGKFLQTFASPPMPYHKNQSHLSAKAVERRIKKKGGQCPPLS
jgi:hypothetical protein